MVNKNTFILIIDDSSTIRTFLADVLSRNGFQTLVAETMELALLDAVRKEFDLAIIDIFMPGMGGIEGISKIRECSPNAKILAISAGYGDMDKMKTLQAASMQGADMTMAKPFEEEELLAAINGLLGDGDEETEAGAEAPAPAG